MSWTPTGSAALSRSASKAPSHTHQREMEDLAHVFSTHTGSAGEIDALHAQHEIRWPPLGWSMARESDRDLRLPDANRSIIHHCDVPDVPTAHCHRHAKDNRCPAFPHESAPLYRDFPRCILPRAGLRMQRETREVVGCMADSTSNAVWRTACRVVFAALLAISLGGCSFDLGSFSLGPDKETPKAPAVPTTEISQANIRDAQGHAAQGQVLVRSGRTEEAMAEFEKALALDPYNVPALNGRGTIHQGERRHQEAIDDFTAAHGLVPQRADPLVARATSYLALDKVKEAAADLDEAVQSDPNNGHAWSMRGFAYERLGDKAKAAASYNRALAIRPRDDAARSGLARVGG